jgi:hypothetical protein
LGTFLPRPCTARFTAGPGVTVDASIHSITTAADARSLFASAHPLVPSPPSYDGTLQDFAGEYVIPNLPSAETVEVFHDQLRAYILAEDPLFLVRAVRGTERRGIYKTDDRTRFKATDNAPAWWTALAQGYQIDDDAFAEVIATMPAHLFDVAKTCAPTANGAGWHIAHIFDVKDRNVDYERWTRVDIAERFIRNIHPCNYFLLAHPEWQRWGRQDSVINYFAGLYERRYKRIWPDFHALAGYGDCGFNDVSEPIPYHYFAAHSERTAETPSTRSAAVNIAASTNRAVAVEYQAPRLLFKRDIIETLDVTEAFRIVTPVGTFQMTKAEFYDVFANVVATRSYRQNGIYHYSTLPQKAERFRV